MEVDLQAIEQDLNKIPVTQEKSNEPDNRKPEGNNKILLVISTCMNQCEYYE